MMAVIIAIVAVTFAYVLLRGNRKPKKVDKEALTLHATAEEFGTFTKGVHWTSDRNIIKEVNYSKTGSGAIKAVTLIAVFKEAVKKRGDKICMRIERPTPEPVGKKVPPALPLEEWKTWTFQEYYDEVRVVARAFIKLGLEPKTGVNVFGFNSPEWFMGELAGIMAGGIAAGIYPSDTADQVTFKARHSGASIAVCESSDKAKIFTDAAAAGNLPDLRAVVVWDENAQFEQTKVGNITVVHWRHLASIAEAVDEATLEQRISAQQPGSVCAYIYTSGTTGKPKAVMTTHDNIVYEACCAIPYMAPVGVEDEEERVLSFLPLSHIAGMLIDIICPIILSARCNGWVSVAFARPYDLKLGTIVDRLAAVQPTIFLGVPRVWEKIAEKMKAKGASIKEPLKSISAFCKDKGLQHSKNLQLGGSGEYPPFYGLAEKLVLSKVAAALGLSKLKYGLTGAAPIHPETLEYFGQLGIEICELYGMSECGGAVTGSTNACHRWGSCGFAVPGVEVVAFKIGTHEECPKTKNLRSPSDEEQGELCYRGRNIMAGYMANPDMGAEHVADINKKNEDAIDEFGWLHSGDKGAIDEQGMVCITGRYKELIITAGGENVAPVPIEDAIKSLCPAISNVMMIGDKQKFNIAFITLKAKGATGDLPGGDDLDVGANNLVEGVTTISGAKRSEAFIAAVTKAIVETNKNGAVCPSNASKIQKFCILPHDFSMQGEELTPTLKLKRAFTQGKYGDLVTKVYASKETHVLV